MFYKHQSNHRATACTHTHTHTHTHIYRNTKLWKIQRFQDFYLCACESVEMLEIMCRHLHISYEFLKEKSCKVPNFTSFFQSFFCHSDCINMLNNWPIFSIVEQLFFKNSKDFLLQYFQQLWMSSGEHELEIIFETGIKEGRKKNHGEVFALGIHHLAQSMKSDRKMKVTQSCPTPWTIQSLEFSRPEYWSG